MSESTLSRPATVLKPGVIYATYSEYVCANVGCAGMTALDTGRSRDGVRLTRLSAAEVAAWPVAELGPLRCECRSLEASLNDKGMVVIVDAPAEVRR